MNTKVSRPLLLVIMLGFLSCSEENNEAPSDSRQTKSEMAKEEESEKKIPFYSFKGYDKCAFYDDHSLSFDTMNKYGRNVPYHIEFIDSTKFTLVKFEAIFDCCQEATGSIEIVNDSVLLNWGVHSEGGVCECLCDYEYNFFLPKDNYDPEIVKINTVASSN